MCPASGMFCLIKVIPLSVSLADWLYTGSPLARVKVSVSNSKSLAERPHSCAMSKKRRAISSFLSAEIAKPFSSMVRQTTIALYFLAKLKTLRTFSSPSSKCTELIKHRPGQCCKPASITSWSTLSMTSGTGTSSESFLAKRAIFCASSPPSAKATLRSKACAPKANWSCAICKIPSSSPASKSRLNAFDPAALSRSPTIKGLGSCSIATDVIDDAKLGMGFGFKGFAVVLAKPSAKA